MIRPRRSSSQRHLPQVQPPHNACCPFRGSRRGGKGISQRGQLRLRVAPAKNSTATAAPIEVITSATMELSFQLVWMDEKVHALSARTNSEDLANRRCP